MTESSEQHLVIKPHFQNSVQKAQKPIQNGKGHPNLEHQNTKNRARRRSRGGRKSDQGEVFMMPNSRPCTVARKPNAPEITAGALVARTNPNPNGANNSSKSVSFAPRPGFGQVGTKCIVKANHFFAELPDKDLNQYDVSFGPFHLTINLCCKFKFLQMKMNKFLIS